MVIAASVIVISIGFIEQATGKTIAAMLGLGITGDDVYAAEVLRPNFRAGELRSKAVFYHPIVFAQYLGWAAPFLFMSLRENVGVLYRACALLSLMCLPAAIASTGTRSGLICALVAAILYFAVRMMQRVRMSFGATMIVLSVATVFGCVLFGLSQEILGDLITGRDSTEFGSTQVRLRMLEIGLSNIQHSPIYGYGDGRAAYYAGNFTGGTAFYTIDNFYLSTLLNNGWVGLLLLVLSWGALPIAALRFAVALRRPVDAAVFAAVASLLLSFSIVSITDGISFLLVSLAVVGIQPSSRTAPSTLGVSPKPLQQQASAA